MKMPVKNYHNEIKFYVEYSFLTFCEPNNSKKNFFDENIGIPKRFKNGYILNGYIDRFIDNKGKDIGKVTVANGEIFIDGYF